MTRYFMATDGTKTFFRQSRTRVYRSITIRTFSVCFSQDGAENGRQPVVEITRDEFAQLVRARDRMMNRVPGGGTDGHLYAEDSWVANEELIREDEA
jgi:hypothetical protein